MLKKRHSESGLPTPGFRVGLAAKLAVSLIASTAALFVVFGYFNITEQRRRSEEMVLQSAERITDVIQRSTHYEMLRNDRQALYNVIQELGSEPGIRRIRIFDNQRQALRAGRQARPRERRGHVIPVARVAPGDRAARRECIALDG